MIHFRWVSIPRRLPGPRRRGPAIVRNAPETCRERAGNRPRCGRRATRSSMARAVCARADVLLRLDHLQFLTGSAFVTGGETATWKSIRSFSGSGPTVTRRDPARARNDSATGPPSTQWRPPDEPTGTKPGGNGPAEIIVVPEMPPACGYLRVRVVRWVEATSGLRTAAGRVGV